MRSLNRLAIGLVTTVIVVVVSLFVILSSNLGTLIVEKVQTVGSSIIQTAVTLKQADVAISGEGQLKGLTVANPAGYKNELALELGTIQLVIDSDTLASPIVRIKSIHIKGPKINYEVSKEAESNLQHLLNNVGISIEQNESSQGKKNKTQKLIIDQLTLTEGELTIFAAQLDSPIQRSLPEITLNTIGKEKSGSSAADILFTVMQHVITRAITEGNIALEEVK